MDKYLERNARTLYRQWHGEYCAYSQWPNQFDSWLEYRIRRILERHERGDYKQMMYYIMVRHLPPLITCEIIEDYDLKLTNL